jgi:hypothetical protein
MSRSVEGSEPRVVRGRGWSRRVAIVGAALVAAGVITGAVIASRIEWSDNAARLDAALDAAQPVQLADIPAADGMPTRGVFAQITSTGHFCISDAPVGAPRTGGGGCNPADDPLGGSSFSASLAYEGGPAIMGVTDARLIGLASVDVLSMRVLMSDGTSRAIKLKKAKVGSDEFQAFGFRFKKSDLKKGVGPTAVVAYDDDGIEIGLQRTGIGS